MHGSSGHQDDDKKCMGDGKAHPGCPALMQTKFHIFCSDTQLLGGVFTANFFTNNSEVVLLLCPVRILASGVTEAFSGLFSVLGYYSFLQRYLSDMARFSSFILPYFLIHLIF